MNTTIMIALQAISIILIIVSAIFFIVMLNMWRKDTKQTTRILYIVLTSILISLAIATFAYGFRII